MPALTAQSFYYGVQRAEHDAFAPVKAALTTDGSPTIALPSRLSGSGPLAGLRIAYKDIYAVKGPSLVCSDALTPGRAADERRQPRILLDRLAEQRLRTVNPASSRPGRSLRRFDEDRAVRYGTSASVGRR